LRLDRRYDSIELELKRPGLEAPQERAAYEIAKLSAKDQCCAEHCSRPRNRMDE
jgi:hypothetical protein